MKNPRICVGFTLLSEENNGGLRISTFDGLMYAGVDDLQATMIQDTLTEEFGQEFDALKHKLRSRMVELGYAASLAAGADAGEVTKAQGMGGKGKGKGPGRTG